MRKKVIYIISALILGVAICLILFNTEKPGIEIDLSSHKIDLTYRSVQCTRETTELFGIQDDIYHFCSDKSDAKLSITIRRIDESTHIVFYNFIHGEKASYNIDIKLPALINAKPLSGNEIQKEHNNVIGIDFLTLPDIYLYGDEKSILISKQICSQKLTTQYDDGAVSTVTKFIEEKNTGIDNNTISISFDETQSDTDGWIIVSNSQMITDITGYCEFLNNEISSSTWLTPNGQYSKIPWSIDPFTERGYARIVGLNQGKVELEKFETIGEPIYNILMRNKLVSLFNMPRHDTGVWYTEYTSTYTGLHGPFIDTRYNEQVSAFLRIMSNKYNYSELSGSDLYYPDFVVSEVERGNTLPVGDYYLIPDYYNDENPPKQTHASLNHQLGTANVLLQSYFNTNNMQYYNVGMSILNAIAFMGDNWLRDNGDTYYKVTTDLEYLEIDYKTLTLQDLLEIQDILEKINEQRKPEFDSLIRSKYSFLKDSNYPIPEKILNILERQGF